MEHLKSLMTFGTWYLMSPLFYAFSIYLGCVAISRSWILLFNPWREHVCNELNPQLLDHEDISTSSPLVFIAKVRAIQFQGGAVKCSHALNQHDQWREPKWSPSQGLLDEDVYLHTTGVHC
jgi:hypothetical protein